MFCRHGAIVSCSDSPSEKPVVARLRIAMINRVSRAATREVVRSVLAADCACPASAFVADGLFVIAAEERPGRRRYPQAAKPLGVVTMGRGVVVSCHPP